VSTRVLRFLRDHDLKAAEENCVSFVCDTASQLIFLLGVLNHHFFIFYGLLPGYVSSVTTLRFDIFPAFEREDFKMDSHTFVTNSP